MERETTVSRSISSLYPATPDFKMRIADARQKSYSEATEDGKIEVVLSRL